MWPALNFEIPWLTFSRLRPDHTCGVIFAFGGSALMGTCYYGVQRTGHARLAFTKLAGMTFWGWQLVCVLAMVTMPLGLTQSKEYAEPEWFIDILIAVVWVSFGVVFFGSLTRRRIKHIRSEEHTSELQSLMRISYAVFCLKKKTKKRK